MDSNIQGRFRNKTYKVVSYFNLKSAIQLNQQSLLFNHAIYIKAVLYKVMTRLIQNVNNTCYCVIIDHRGIPDTKLNFIMAYIECYVF